MSPILARVPFRDLELQGANRFFVPRSPRAVPGEMKNRATPDCGHLGRVDVDSLPRVDLAGAWGGGAHVFLSTCEGTAFACCRALSILRRVVDRGSYLMRENAGAIFGRSFDCVAARTVCKTRSRVCNDRASVRDPNSGRGM